MKKLGIISIKNPDSQVSPQETDGLLEKMIVHKVTTFVNGNINNPNINIFNISLPMALEYSIALALSIKDKDVFENNGEAGTGTNTRIGFSGELARRVVNLVLNGASVSPAILTYGSVIEGNTPELITDPVIVKSYIINKLVHGLTTLHIPGIVTLSLGETNVRAGLLHVYKDINTFLLVKTGTLLNKAAVRLGIRTGPIYGTEYMTNVLYLRDYHWGEPTDGERRPTPVIILPLTDENVVPEVRLNLTFNHRQLGYSDAWLARKISEAGAAGDDVPAPTSDKVRNLHQELDNFMVDVDYVLGTIGNASGKIESVRAEIIRNWLVANNYLSEIHDALLRLTDK